MSKTLFKSIAIVIFLITSTASLKAQWFLGGDVGINVRSRSGETTINNLNFKDAKMTEVGFTLAPKVGYYFNEKFAFGLNLSVGYSFVTETLEEENKYRGHSVYWNVYPFVRYSVLTYKKFSLILEGTMGAGGRHNTVKHRTNEIKTDILTIGVFNLTPILGFRLTDRLQLETGLRFLSLGYNIDIIKTKTEQETSDYIDHNFDIGFNSSRIFAVSQLTIGVIYKFQ